MAIDMIMQSTALYPELDTSTLNGSIHEDERALQIALELSNLGLLGINDDDPTNFEDLAKGKKSQNMTECVPVPSSEHVAEIVGRQGCKIKALRAKTNTYIKTPVRGEDPVFVVTGRKEDVAMARREVQSAAEHFTQIRASRNRHALLASQALGSISADGTAGTITLQVRVPYRVVGLVVGPKGATIKRIQQQTHTYIVTPSRDKEPVFEVTGLPENVEKAKEEIEAHIATRTGSQQTSVDDDFRNNGTDVDSPYVQSEFAKMTTPSSTAASFVPSNSINNSVLRPAASSFFPLSVNSPTYPVVSSTQQSPMMVPKSSDFRLGERKFQPNPVPNHAINGGYSVPEASKPNLSWNMNKNTSSTLPSYLPIINNTSALNSSLAQSQQQNRLSPTLSEKEFASFQNILLPPSTQSLHLPVRRVPSEESTTSSVPSMELGNLLTPTSNYSSAATPAVNIESGYSSSGTTDSITSGSPDSAMGHLQFYRDCLPSKPQRCVVCNEHSVSAALVPCGHHLFCYNCAEEVVSKKPALCPCCHVNASRALLIKQ